MPGTLGQVAGEQSAIGDALRDAPPSSFVELRVRDRARQLGHPVVEGQEIVVGFGSP